MGRRFLLGTGVGFLGMVIGAGWGWFTVGSGTRSGVIPAVLAAGAPAVAGLALVLCVIGFPTLAGDRLARPSTFCLPAIHVAFTALSARAMLTGPSATAAFHEDLAGVTTWFRPASLLVLFAVEVAVLEVVAAVGSRRAG